MWSAARVVTRFQLWQLIEESAEKPGAKNGNLPNSAFSRLIGLSFGLGNSGSLARGTYYWTLGRPVLYGEVQDHVFPETAGLAIPTQTSQCKVSRLWPFNGITRARVVRRKDPFPWGNSSGCWNRGRFPATISSGETVWPTGWPPARKGFGAPRKSQLRRPRPRVIPCLLRRRL
jgi:hypothetical protein